MKNYWISIKWFTLIEMLIAITIFFIIVVMSYVPYSYYQNKAKLRISVKEISQSISEAKNLAINGYTNSWINNSIWLYFDTSSDKIKYFSYPYTYSWSQIQISWDSNIKLIKEKKMLPWIKLDKIEWNENILMFFSAIYWTWSFYYWDEDWNRQNLSQNIINIDISYKWATTPNLQKTIRYYKNTGMIDY